MTTKKHNYKTNRFLKRLYNELNHDYFDDKLPKDIPVIWSDDVEYNILGKTMWRVANEAKGYEPYEIRVSNRLKKLYLQRTVGMLVLHEMNHIQCGVEISCEEYGGEFDKKMFELAARGAMQTFW